MCCEGTGNQARLVEALDAAMQCVDAVVDRQLVGLAVQGELSLADPVDKRKKVRVGNADVIRKSFR